MVEHKNQVKNIFYVVAQILTIPTAREEGAKGFITVVFATGVEFRQGTGIKATPSTEDGGDISNGMKKAIVVQYKSVDYDTRSGRHVKSQGKTVFQYTESHKLRKEDNIGCTATRQERNKQSPRILPK